MMSRDAHDAGVTPLDRLVCLTPDAARAERVRLRCRTRLERGHPVARANAKAAAAWRMLAPAVVSGVCVLYLVALLATTAGVQDALRQAMGQEPGEATPRLDRAEPAWSLHASPSR